MNATAVKPKSSFAREFLAWMNLAIKARSSTVSAAPNGSAELISLTPNGIPVRPSRARVDAQHFDSQKDPLALAQHLPREFLTEARGFASVRGGGVPHTPFAPHA